MVGFPGKCGIPWRVWWASLEGVLGFSGECGHPTKDAGFLVGVGFLGGYGGFPVGSGLPWFVWWATQGDMVCFPVGSGLPRRVWWASQGERLALAGVVSPFRRV